MSRVEEFELVDVAAPGHALTVRPRRRRPYQHVGLWSALAVVLVLAGTSLARPVALGHGTGIEIGLSELNLAAAPTVLWESSTDAHEVVGVTASRAVLAGMVEGPARDVVGVDLETGDEVWRYHDDDWSCQWSEPVTCVDGPGTATAVAVLIDVETGAQERREHPGVLAGVAFGDDLILAFESDSPPLETVVRIGPDGRERWRTAADAVSTTSMPMWALMQIRGAQLGLMDGSLDLTTGDEATGWWLQDGIAYERHDAGGATLHTPSGGVGILPEELLPSITDDLAGPVALTGAEQEVAAVTRVSGIELWRREASQCFPHAQLDGVVVLGCWTDSGTAVALDLLTGTEQWRLPDADRALAGSRDALLFYQASAAQVVAVDPRTGASRWALPIDADGDGAPRATEVDGGLLLISPSAIIRLGFAS